MIPASIAALAGEYPLLTGLLVLVLLAGLAAGLRGAGRAGRERMEAGAAAARFGPGMLTTSHRADAARAELVRAREALRVSELQLHLITENVPAMIVYYDRNFVCRFANSQYASFFGYTVRGIFGKHLSEIIGAQSYERTALQFKRVLNGESVSYERMHQSADGSTRYISVTFAPERNVDGSVKGSYALVTDITAYKEAEEAIRTHALRQEAIAIYGQYALETRDIDKLIANAAAMSTSGLDVTHSAVYRQGAGSEPLVQIAGVGWRATAPAQVSRGSSTGRALIATQPAIVDDFRAPGAGPAPENCVSEELVSCIEVAIPTSEGAFGVIGAYSREPGRFTKDDASFLMAIATSLGTAIGRKRAEERLAYVAQFDSLTGLPNRTLFRDRLSQAMSRA